jgi:hypothetical protein
LINLTGGIRSSAAFHASASMPYNPYGMMQGVVGAPPFALGRILDDTPPGDPPLPDSAYDLSASWQMQRLPRLREFAPSFSVLGTYSTDRGDHLKARIEEPTGSASGGAPGVLTRIAAGLAASQFDTGAPPFHIQPSALFGNGVGPITKYVPVSLASYASVPSASTVDPQWVSDTGNDWAADDAMRDRLDVDPVAARHNIGKLVSETLSHHRRAARDIGVRLSQDDFALASQPTGTLGDVTLPGGTVPLTNEMLVELFSKGVPPFYQFVAYNAALAVRLLQIGSPAVALETPTFDFHSGEVSFGPPLYNYFGRLWAALGWLLARIPAGGGSTLLDRTLVITMSDFGRDKAGTSGFNGGAGSDHGADFACFYLAHAVMGAGVTPNKLVGPVDTNHYDASQSPIRYTPQQLLVTILDALGLDPANEEWGLPTGGTAIAELWS